MAGVDKCRFQARAWHVQHAGETRKGAVGEGPGPEPGQRVRLWPTDPRGQDGDVVAGRGRPPGWDGLGGRVPEIREGAPSRAESAGDRGLAPESFVEEERD